MTASRSGAELARREGAVGSRKRMTTRTAALIGTGMVARTHLLAIRDADPSVRLAAVLARNADRAGEFAAQAERDCADLGE